MLTRSILGNGIRYSTREPLIAPIDEEAFGKRIQESLFKNAQEVRSLAQTSLTTRSFRGEIERKIVDLGDPKVAGWAFLLNENDPHYSEIIDIIKPLAKHRGMDHPESPLTFAGHPEDQWFDWIQDNYNSLVLDDKKPPHYVLIVGDPKLVPFKFQSLLDSAASVGRVDFDSLDDLKTYVEKVIRLERLSRPKVRKEAIIFAPDAGVNDPTYFSRRYMAKPLTDHISNSIGFKTTSILGANATKKKLEKALHGSNPALVYTASHGLGAPDQNLQTQRTVNGAICCQRVNGQQRDDEFFMADDVPIDEPFLEGSVFFQFACFGYGTPSQSDFMHWLGSPELNSEEDFVAAMPKRLLAHPRGPVAYIGHLDTAWLHGFDDPTDPSILEKWHPRIAPFVFAVNTLLKETNPIGMAMVEMNKRYDITNAILTSTLDRLARGKIQINTDYFSRIADTFITRSDAQNYMVFGDPAVRLRIRMA